MILEDLLRPFFEVLRSLVEIDILGVSLIFWIMVGMVIFYIVSVFKKSDSRRKKLRALRLLGICGFRLLFFLSAGECFVERSLL